MRPYIIITLIVSAIMLLGKSCSEAERARKAATPVQQRPYTINCFTPKGWVEFKSFSANPTTGVTHGYKWRIKREDGTYFTSSMCPHQPSPQQGAQQ